jgi:hypothetical protein
LASCVETVARCRGLSRILLIASLDLDLADRLTSRTRMCKCGFLVADGSTASVMADQDLLAARDFVSRGVKWVV